MADDIEKVKQSATQIVNQITSERPFTHISIVLYKDFGDTYVSKTALSFTADTTKILEAINGITIGGGGDIPEAVYSGLIHATDSLDDLGNWRQEGEVRKVIIQMGDAPGHNPEPHDQPTDTGYTRADVIEHALAGGVHLGGPPKAAGEATVTPINIYSIMIGTDTAALADFQAIVDGTGGELFRALTANEVVTAMMAAIDVAAEGDASDFGDAPVSYGTLAANNGPSHRVGTLFLGAGVDDEADGLPSATALGDDSDGDDDENGVTMATGLLTGSGANLSVVSSGVGLLDAWIDFNQDGDFLDAGEKIAANKALVAGVNVVSLDVPAAAVAGATYARFRLSTAGNLAPTGPADDGEVEDYRVTILKPNAGSTQVIDDPQNPGHGLLVAYGTTRTDVITVNLIPAISILNLPARVQVLNQTIRQFADSTFERILVNALEGNDVVLLDPRLTKGSLILGGTGDDVLYGAAGGDEIHGGAGRDTIMARGGEDLVFGEDGNDSLFGDAGDDVVSGGLGTDYLYGGAGRDVLNGGQGADSLYGLDGEDILIGGNWVYDNDRAGLLAIRDLWRGAGAFTTRVAGLASRINNTKISDDGARDSIFGGTGRDWLIDYANRDLFFDLLLAGTSADRKN